MSEPAPTLAVCPDSFVRYERPRIPAEEVLRRLQDEIDKSLDHLSMNIREDHAMDAIHKLTHLLTGRPRAERTKKNLQKVREPEPSRDEPRETIPLSVSTKNYRKLLLRRGGCRCRFCGCKLNEENSNIDHLIPRSQGGDNSPANLVLTCITCNGLKGGRTPEQWAADILRAAQGDCFDDR